MQAKGSAAQSGSNPLKQVRDVRAELSKVVWPTPRQTASYTGFVIAFTVLVGLLIMGLDAIFNLGFHVLMG
jgi:preprotein translocase subunit SecE